MSRDILLQRPQNYVFVAARVPLPCAGVECGLECVATRAFCSSSAQLVSSGGIRYAVALLGCEYPLVQQNALRLLCSITQHGVRAGAA